MGSVAGSQEELFSAGHELVILGTWKRNGRGNDRWNKLGVGGALLWGQRAQRGQEDAPLTERRPRAAGPDPASRWEDTRPQALLPVSLGDEKGGVPPEWVQGWGLEGRKRHCGEFDVDLSPNQRELNESWPWPGARGLASESGPFPPAQPLPFSSRADLCGI